MRGRGDARSVAFTERQSLTTRKSIIIRYAESDRAHGGRGRHSGRRCRRPCLLPLRSGLIVVYLPGCTSRGTGRRAVSGSTAPWIGTGRARRSRYRSRAVVRRPARGGRSIPRVPIAARCPLGAAGRACPQPGPGLDRAGRRLRPPVRYHGRARVDDGHHQPGGGRGAHRHRRLQSGRADRHFDLRGRRALRPGQGRERPGLRAGLVRAGRLL